jgi:hypothetical protein
MASRGCFWKVPPGGCKTKSGGLGGKLNGEIDWFTCLKHSTTTKIIHAVCLDVTIKKKNTKVIIYQIFFLQKIRPCFWWLLSPTMALFQQVYPQFPSPRKPTPLLASPRSLQRMLDKIFLFFGPDLPIKVRPGWGYPIVTWKGLILCHYKQRIFFSRQIWKNTYTYFQIRSVSKLLACSVQK